MVVVMRLIGRPTPGGEHYPMPASGQFLRAFDFEAERGRGMIDMTPDPELAMRFDTMAAAIEFTRRSPQCRPVRPDGRPNRPLTATTWEYLSLETARAGR